MDKIIVEVSRYFYSAPGLSVFICLVSDNEKVSPIKVKIKKDSALLAYLNPDSCKAILFIRNKNGVSYHHHVDIDFVHRKSWLEFNLKQFIEKIGLKYSDVVGGPCIAHNVSIPYIENRVHCHTDTQYGITLIDIAPPRLKYVYLVRDALTLCGKSVAKIEYWGRTNKSKNLPQELVLRPHNWTTNNINDIVQLIPQNGLTMFTVYFYDINTKYGFSIGENRVNIIIDLNDGHTARYTHLTPELADDKLVKIGFEMLFNCISAKDLDGIKAKISKYELFGY